MCLSVYVYILYILYVSAHEPGLRIAYLEHVIAQVCLCVYMHITHHMYITYILYVFRIIIYNKNIGSDERAALDELLP